MNIAAIIGRFIGAVLAECGPVLVTIFTESIRAAFTDTIEDGISRSDLRERLLRKLRDASNRDTTGGAGSTPGTPT